MVPVTGATHRTFVFAPPAPPARNRHDSDGGLMIRRSAYLTAASVVLGSVLFAGCGGSDDPPAGAHKLAQLFYRMLKFGETYVERGQTYYETKYKERLLRNLNRRAKEFGLQLAPL